jgi:hypothetical protein
LQDSRVLGRVSGEKDLRQRAFASLGIRRVYIVLHKRPRNLSHHASAIARNSVFVNYAAVLEFFERHESFFEYLMRSATFDIADKPDSTGVSFSLPNWLWTRLTLAHSYSMRWAHAHISNSAEFAPRMRCGGSEIGIDPARPIKLEGGTDRAGDPK